MCQCVCVCVFGNSSANLLRSLSAFCSGAAVSKRYILSWLRVKHAKCVCITQLAEMLSTIKFYMGNQDSMANTQCSY